MQHDPILHDSDGRTIEERAEPAEEFVTIPRAELERLRAAAARELSRGDEGEEHARRLAELDRKAAEWEQSYKAAVRDRELATALAGKPLVPGAASQLIRLWREDFEVHEEDGGTRVVARDGRPVDRAVADRLNSPEYAHFRAPATRGGTVSQGGQRPTVSPAVPVAPRTLGEALLTRWREAVATASDADAASPIGLRWRR